MLLVSNRFYTYYTSLELCPFVADNLGALADCREKFYLMYRNGACNFMISFSRFSLPAFLSAKRTSRFLHQTTLKRCIAKSTELWCYTSCKFYSQDRHVEIPWHGPFPTTTLLEKLDLSLNNQQYSEAWELFNDIKKLHGFPNLPLLEKLVTELCSSSESSWLGKAYHIVLSVPKDKPELLRRDYLATLAVSLARAGMPVRASSVSRIILENNKIIPVDVWATIFLHMVKTPTGAYLASDILADICEKHISKYPMFTAPNVAIFSLVLKSCVEYGATLKAQHMIEDLLPRTGFPADAQLMAIISVIYERNGLLDELKKFAAHIRKVPTSLDRHYVTFYNSLLSLYFKYNDVDAAAELIQCLYQRCFSVSCSGESTVNCDGKPEVVHLGSYNLRRGLILRINPWCARTDFIFRDARSANLVGLVNEILMVRTKGIARLIIRYMKYGNVVDLANALSKIGKVMPSLECSNFLTDIISAVVELGWLETAHDLLDSFGLAQMPVGISAYNSLLKSYYVKNQTKEAKILSKQMSNLGMKVITTDRKNIGVCLIHDDDSKTEASIINLSDLAYFLSEESKEEFSVVQTTLLELNSSIHFFAKAQMMEDATKVYRKMLQRKIQPTVETFSFLMNGYSSLECYSELTILWGEMRRRIDAGVLSADWCLLDSLLVHFIKGGYFRRVLEIGEYMKKASIFTDKWKYRREYLRHHKNLYRNLRASDAKDDAQKKRIENIWAFKKWVDIA